MLWYVHELLTNSNTRAEPLGVFAASQARTVSSCSVVLVSDTCLPALAPSDLDAEGDRDCPASTFLAVFKEKLNLLENTFTASHHREIDHRQK